MPSRRLFLATAALLPLGADAGQRKKRRKRRCPKPRVCAETLPGNPPICVHEFCGFHSPPCGPEGENCRCFGTGSGFGLCAKIPDGLAPGCGRPECDPAWPCIATCEHPEVRRCYEPCR